MKRFIKSKLEKLSLRSVSDLEAFQSLIDELDTRSPNLESIKRKAISLGSRGINTYATPLILLEKYLKKSKKPLNQESVRAFLRIESKRLSPSTIQGYQRAIAEFLKFKKIDFETSKLNQSSTTPSYFKEHELKKIIKEFDTLKERDAQILKIIAHTGARVSEILGLVGENVREDEGIYTLKILGKGGKVREIICKRESVGEIPRKKGLIFTNKQGERLSQVYLYRIFSGILERVGVESNKRGVHTLRHSFASLVYKKTQDLILVKEALGHATIETSKIYTHLDLEKKAKILEIF